MPPRRIQAPKITAPSHPELRDSDPAVVYAGADVDGVRIADADLSDLRLASVTWEESEFDGAILRNTRLPGARLLDVRLARLDAVDVVAAGSTWRDSEIVASRLGAISVYDAEISSLRIAGSKIGFLNLRGSVIHDLVVEDCAIEEIDLSEATVTRATLPGCTVDTLTVRNATLRHVDLRGARLGVVEPVLDLRGVVIDAGQLLDLAPMIAERLGIVVE